MVRLVYFHIEAFTPTHNGETSNVPTTKTAQIFAFSLSNTNSYN